MFHKNKFPSTLFHEGTVAASWASSCWRGLWLVQRNTNKAGYFVLPYSPMIDGLAWPFSSTSTQDCLRGDVWPGHTKSTSTIRWWWRPSSPPDRWCLSQKDAVEHTTRQRLMANLLVHSAPAWQEITLHTTRWTQDYRYTNHESESGV